MVMKDFLAGFWVGLWKDSVVVSEICSMERSMLLDLQLICSMMWVFLLKIKVKIQSKAPQFHMDLKNAQNGFFQTLFHFALTYFISIKNIRENCVKTSICPTLIIKLFELSFRIFRQNCLPLNSTKRRAENGQQKL